MKEKKYLLVKFIPSKDINREDKLTKCHEVFNENLWPIVQDAVRKGFFRKHAGSVELVVTDYNGFEEAMIICAADYIHDLKESLDLYYQFIKEKDLVAKKEIEGKLFTLDLQMTLTQEQKDEHIKYMFAKKQKRKRKKADSTTE